MCIVKFIVNSDYLLGSDKAYFILQAYCFSVFGLFCKDPLGNLIIKHLSWECCMESSGCIVGYVLSSIMSSLLKFTVEIQMSKENFLIIR